MLEQARMMADGNKRICTWFGSYLIIPHLAEMIAAKNVLEIGDTYGYPVDFICTTIPSLQYIGVDPC